MQSNINLLYNDMCLGQVRHKRSNGAETQLLCYNIYDIEQLLRILSGLFRLECNSRVIRGSYFKGKS